MIPNHRVADAVLHGNLARSYPMLRCEDSSSSSSSCAVVVGVMYRPSAVVVVHPTSMMVGTTAVVSLSSSYLDDLLLDRNEVECVVVNAGRYRGEMNMA